MLATSYASETNLTDYATARGITLTGNTTSLLLQAMDYLESLDFIGFKYRDNELQVLQWPRCDVYIDGYYNDVDVIPAQLIKGQLAVACAIDAGNGPLIDLPRNVSREKVGELEVEYAGGSASTIINRTIKAELHKLLAGNGGIVVSKA